ncbi:MAG: DNA polymerase III subunit beta, partial [Beijerinckiaceae bacterium]
KFKLATLPFEDFPQMASADYVATLEFQGLELKNAIEKTAWAASTEETRYYLNGIAMQYSGGKANFIATDGHRLAWYVDGDTADFPNVIIPSKTAKIFKDLLDDGTATVQVSETKIKLTFGTVSVVSKVIDGTYPDWARIIPKDNANSVTMTSTDAKQAVERVITVATERTKAVGLSINDGELKFHVTDQTGGSATETLAPDQIGLDAELGVNSKYALDAFAQADKGAVTIHYSGPGDAMLIKYDKEPKLTVVTMPMRT